MLFSKCIRIFETKICRIFLGQIKVINHDNIIYLIAWLWWRIYFIAFGPITWVEKMNWVMREFLVNKHCKRPFLEWFIKYTNTDKNISTDLYNGLFLVSHRRAPHRNLFEFIIFKIKWPPWKAANWKKNKAWNLSN